MSPTVSLTKLEDFAGCEDRANVPSLNASLATESHTFTDVRKARYICIPADDLGTLRYHQLVYWYMMLNPIHNLEQNPAQRYPKESLPVLNLRLDSKSQPVPLFWNRYKNMSSDSGADLPLNGLYRLWAQRGEPGKHLLPLFDHRHA